MVEEFICQIESLYSPYLTYLSWQPYCFCEPYCHIVLPFSMCNLVFLSAMLIHWPCCFCRPYCFTLCSAERMWISWLDALWLLSTLSFGVWWGFMCEGVSAGVVGWLICQMCCECVAYSCTSQGEALYAQCCVSAMPVFTIKSFLDLLPSLLVFFLFPSRQHCNLPHLRDFVYCYHQFSNMNWISLTCVVSSNSC